MAKMKTNHTRSSGRAKSQMAALVRTFGELPVVDALGDMLIMPTNEDIEKAVPADPEHCVFSECCRRTLGSLSVVFFKTCAYVDIPNPKGDGRVVARFELPQRTRELIQEFDRGHEVNPGGYLLKKPNPGSTLEAKREIRQACRDRKRKAIIAGTFVEGESRESKRRYAFTVGVRNGTGRVHFAREAS